MSSGPRLVPPPAVDPLETLDAEGEEDGPLPITRPGADRYELGAEVAHGAMGRVVEAFDKELRRTVALKVMVTRAKGARRRFVREAQIAAQLDHPNVVPIHEVGVLPSGALYYAMKLVREPLALGAFEEAADRLAERRRGLLPIGRAPRQCAQADGCDLFRDSAAAQA